MLQGRRGMSALTYFASLELRSEFEDMVLLWCVASYLPRIAEAASVQASPQNVSCLVGSAEAVPGVCSLKPPRTQLPQDRRA